MADCESCLPCHLVAKTSCPREWASEERGVTHHFWDMLRTPGRRQAVSHQRRKEWQQTGTQNGHYLSPALLPTPSPFFSSYVCLFSNPRVCSTTAHAGLSEWPPSQGMSTGAQRDRPKGVLTLPTFRPCEAEFIFCRNERKAPRQKISGPDWDEASMSWQPQLETVYS